ncbi:MAG: hypothetical protein FWF78_03445 [Defluviitaleaceae bacterium]|nr:hypothetical protein [Defluviitaleaceae bacterium]
MKKSTHGGAYVIVVMSSLIILTLVLTALTVTVASRNITARYGYFYGMYDLAVYGNDLVFSMMQQTEYEDLHFYFSNFSHAWELGINIGDIRDEFFANTTTRPTTGGFYITTLIQRYADEFFHEMEVRSRVKILDDYTLSVVELLRIAD